MRPSATRVASRFFQALRQGNFYVFAPFPWGEKKIQPEKLSWDEPSSGVVPVSQEKDYRFFLKNLTSYSFASYQYNYIYKVTAPIRLFTGSEQDCYRLIKKGLVDVDELNRYWGDSAPSDPTALAKWMADKFSDKNRLRGGLLHQIGVSLKGFRSLFDGTFLPTEHGQAYIFEDILNTSMTLIDGTVKRLNLEDKPGVFRFPDWVNEEVLRYTNDPAVRIHKGVVQWLLENAPKSSGPKRVYRGYGTQLDDWGDYSKLTLADVNKRLFRRIGVRDIGKVRVGMPMKVKRAKESSWSVSAQVAANFFSGMASKSINFMVKTDIPSDRVILDFTELPVALRNQFKYQGQGEVIVSSGAVDGVLDSVVLDKDFVKWLGEHGYTFIPQRGIFPV